MANLANLAATTFLVNLKSSASRKQPRKMEVSCQVNSLYCLGARQRKLRKTEQTIFSMIVLLIQKYESGRHDDRVLELKRLWITICRWLRCKKMVVRRLSLPWSKGLPEMTGNARPLWDFLRASC